SCMGNMAKALRIITSDREGEYFFELFVELMRLTYARRVKEMKQWADRVAGMGRERVKAFLDYCQRMVRENFIYNFGRHDELNYMNAAEAQFAVKFAPFINERNVIGIMEELALAQRDIGQNVNAKIVFFDFVLKMTVLIKNR
ncbi:MAG: DNA polymerase III subunit delta, partial [Bacteroidaceae bacterium]|nr:DNA polymerase III subunit delta [Bacteroidaceae bacterium]